MPPVSLSRSRAKFRRPSLSRKSLCVDTYRHVAQRGREQIDVILHGATSLPLTQQGKVPQARLCRKLHILVPLDWHLSTHGPKGAGRNKYYQVQCDQYSPPICMHKMILPKGVLIVTFWYRSAAYFHPPLPHNKVLLLIFKKYKLLLYNPCKVIEIKVKHLATFSIVEYFVEYMAHYLCCWVYVYKNGNNICRNIRALNESDRGNGVATHMSLRPTSAPAWEEMVQCETIEETAKDESKAP